MKNTKIKIYKQKQQINIDDITSFSDLIPGFCDYQLYDLRHAKATVEKYKESLGWLQRYLPNLLDPQEITNRDIIELKKQMFNRNLSESRIGSVIFALRAFLRYCIEIHQLKVLDPCRIKPPKIPKRDVEYIKKPELHQLLNSINTSSLAGLRMAAFMEIAVSSGMRKSEVLGLNRDSIDWNGKQALIIGKGNKQRTVFFTDRALESLSTYLSRREDEDPALFVTQGVTKRWSGHDMSKAFKHYVQLAGLGDRKITPHTLRHTFASYIIHEGGDITYVKDLLGHADIKTTAKYYIGLDKTTLQNAHGKYFIF